VLQLKGVDDLDSVIGFELTRFLSRALLSADKSKSAGRAKDSNEAESALVALFRSRLIDHCIPEFRGIIGLVQHDQYHRLSVDAHILQAARELVRIRKNPKLLGRLSSLTKDWKPRDWQVLIWSCIYHDLAKGRHGDHSIEGAKLAEADLRRLGVDEAQIADVQWIVLRHLSLSRAAFRQNPHSPDVWRELAAQGAVGDRLRLLVVFTVIDIRATNIEAWTPWKDRLLFELIQQLEKPSTAAIVALTTRFSDRLATSFIEQLDPFLVQSLPLKVLIQDLEQLIEIAPSSSLAPLLVRVRNGKQTWIRFHSSVDRPGLLFEFAQSLAQAGLSLRHAAIHTDARVGVYDWFEVKSPKSPAAIRKLIQLSLKRTAPTDEKRASIKSGVSDQSTKVQPRKLLFESVELVSSHQDEWVLSFRGRDHAGALVSAVEALFDVGLEIRWARVHTWGRQIDDVFGVRPHGKVEAEQALLQIRSKF
jgi:[protein-PII] uridylyltransferase